MKLEEFIKFILSQMPEGTVSVCFEVSVDPFGEVVDYSGGNKITFTVEAKSKRTGE